MFPLRRPRQNTELPNLGASFVSNLRVARRLSSGVPARCRGRALREVAIAFAVAAIATAGSSAVAETSTDLQRKTIETQSVPSPARYAVLLPPSYAGGTKRYPLLLWLHGGSGDHDFLATQVGLFESVWQAQLAPEVVVATPDADRSFYLDYRDGSQRWEQFIVDELVPALARDYRVDPKELYVGGVSMGGMGALRLAFKHPDRFRVVIAFEPGIEPALQWRDVQERDKFWRDDALLVARFGTKAGGMDEGYWAANNPATIADTDPKRLIDARLAIYIDVGSEDLFGLDRGANFLHDVLYRHGIQHEFRYVLGADHVGRSLAPRFRDGLEFLGRVTQPPVRDPLVDATRAMIGRMKARAGVADEPAP